jgi:hypothetical protein
MVFKALLIIVIVAILMEDSSSIRKTEEEKEEERELAERVNATLAEEEKKKAEEEKKKEEKDEDQGKKKKEDRKKSGGQEDGDKKDIVEKKEGQDEACLPINCTCPIVKPCPPAVECKPCPDVEPCGPCPPIFCQPCGPDPVVNHTEATPSACQCPGETLGMTVPVALVVGAMASLLITGVATALGLLLRYVPPIVSGFLILAIIVVIWYLCSQYPEAAREIGGRVVETLRAATTTLSHRVVAALQRHRDQVCFPVKLYSPLYNEFHVSFEKFALRFSM